MGDRYKMVQEQYDPSSEGRIVMVNNGSDAEDGCYMTIRQMTKDNMQGIMACLCMGQGEGCRSEDPLINAINRALGEAIDWKEE
jgi:hypothetical protein